MSISPYLAGKVNTGLEVPFAIACPEGSYATGITGNVSDNYIEGIQFQCSDGSKSKYAGLVKGSPYSELSQNGFIGWGKARSDLMINGISFKRSDGSFSKYYGGTGGNLHDEWTCPAGEKIGAILGSKSGDSIAGMYFACGPFDDAVPEVTVQPNAEPTGAGTTYSNPTGVNQTGVNSTGVNSTGVNQTGAGTTYVNGAYDKQQPQDNTMLYMVIFFIFVMIIFAIVIAIKNWSQPVRYDAAWQ